MRIALDATPLLGPRTGVGRYVSALARELGERTATTPGDTVVAIAFSARRARGLAAELPPGVRAVGRPVPARPLQQVWRRAEWPTITSLAGRVDVFHATNFVLPPVGGAAGVVTVHDLSFLRSPGTVTRAARRYRDLVPRSIRRARVVVTPSQAVAAEVLETYRLPVDKVVVTPLGVAEDWFSAAAPDTSAGQQLGLPARYFVFVGNLEPRKNLPLLLDAYRALRAEAPDAPGLVLVGPPGWGPLLDTRGLDPHHLVLTGYQPDPVVRSIVAGATALVYPSVYEGFGLPPLEALACGTPVIASDLPVVREVVGDDPEVARLVPTGDVQALAGAMAALSGGDSSTGRASRRSRARGFTWSRTAQLTRAAYEQALS